MSSLSQMILLLTPLAIVHCFEIRFLCLSLVIRAKAILLCFGCRNYHLLCWVFLPHPFHCRFSTSGGGHVSHRYVLCESDVAFLALNIKIARVQFKWSLSDIFLFYFSIKELLLKCFWVLWTRLFCLMLFVPFPVAYFTTGKWWLFAGLHLW